jgi:hypothetical protein
LSWNTIVVWIVLFPLESQSFPRLRLGVYSLNIILTSEYYPDKWILSWLEM